MDGPPLSYSDGRANSIATTELGHFFDIRSALYYDPITMSFGSKKTTLCLLILPLLFLVLTADQTDAKGRLPRGANRGQGKQIRIVETSGWPVSVKFSAHQSAVIQSYPQMAVVSLKPYNPWWRFYSGIPDKTSVTVSGLPGDQDLHVYTRGYRDHQFVHTDSNGSFSLTLDSKPGNQLIIKSNPSTYHIQVGGFINPDGGDCSLIGAWDGASKTCTLNKNITETIAIDDSGITIDGAGHSVVGGGFGDGIYTDESNVVVKNVIVRSFSRGIVFADSLFTSASGGIIDSVSLGANNIQIYDEGVSGLRIQNSTIQIGVTGIALVDQLDGFPTDGIVIKRNNLLDNTTDISAVGVGFALSTVPDRGNYWDKNDPCVQDEANPSQCAQGYLTDNGFLDAFPWACENGWTHTCPLIIQPSPTPTPTPPSGTTTPTPTLPPAASGDWGEIVKGSPRVTMYDRQDKTIPLKEFPNAWVVNILDSSGSVWKVKDMTDGTVGWMDQNFIKKASTTEENNSLATKATVDKFTKASRASIIIEAVKHYADDTSATAALYSGNDSKFGFNSFIADSKFPLDVIFTILAHEAPSDFDNSFVSFDYGHGITQTTMFPKTRDREYLRAFLIADGVVKTDAFRKAETVGYFGSVTEQAVKDFQKKYGIDAIGIVGPATRSKINSLVSGDTTKYAVVPSGFRFEDLLKVGSFDRTSSGEARGVISEFSIVPCSDLDNPVAKNSHKNCYETKATGETKQYQPHPSYGQRTFMYYTNSAQSIYTNIKDGIGILKNKYYSNPGNIVKNIAVTDPNKIWATSDSGIKINNEDMRILLAVRGYNGFGNDGCKKFNFVIPDDTERANFYSKYLERVADSLLSLNAEYETNTFPKYTTTDPLYQKLYMAVKNKTEICIQSPAYLQIIDSQGRFTGRKGSSIVHQIPQAVYDDESSKAASILFPDGEYRYRVAGTEPDTYTVIFDEFIDSPTPVEFVAQYIPTKPCAVHEYSFDWNLLATGGDGATIKVDQDCDGKFETTIKSDLTLTLDEFNEAAGNGKTTICHVPPGNPSNPQTIAIGKPALKAHLGHGDYEGECKSDGVKVNNKKEVEKKDGENKENKEYKVKAKEPEKKQGSKDTDKQEDKKSKNNK